MGPRSVMFATFVLAVTVCALFALQWRALSSFEIAATQVLTQASQHAAERLASDIQREFKAPVFNVLERIDHTAVYELRLGEIETSLRTQSSFARLIDRVFVWSHGAGITADPPVWFYSMNGDAREDGSQQGFSTDSAFSAVILREGRKFGAIRANFALARVNQGTHSYDLVYHLLYDLPERLNLRAFLGFIIDEQELRDRFFRAIIAGEGSPSQLSGFPPLVVSILDDASREVYRSGPSLSSRFEHEVPFPYFFFDVDIIDSLKPFLPNVRYWQVRTAYEGGDVAALVRQRTNEQRLLWSLAAGAAFVGIILTVRASTRELHLARLRSDFVASVSHELKTPLAKIQLFADTLKAGRARSIEKSQEYAAIISDQAQKLGHMIAGLLDFSQIELGARRYPRTEIDLRRVLERALSSFEYELQRKDFDVELLLPTNEVPVRGNPEGLQQVFENLIGNAIKYSPQRRYLEVAMRTVNGNVKVDVTDHGVGIPRRDQWRIFRRFYRAAHPDTRSVTGSGLGLAIAQHVVEAHGGRVTVASTLGEGSTFSILLPVSRDSPKQGTSDEACIDH